MQYLGVTQVTDGWDESLGEEWSTLRTINGANNQWKCKKGIGLPKDVESFSPLFNEISQLQENWTELI